MSDIVGPTGKRISLQRLFKLNCPCGNEFTVDLGVKWADNLVIRCPKCKQTLGGTSIALEGIPVA